MDSSMYPWISPWIHPYYSSDIVLSIHGCIHGYIRGEIHGLIHGCIHMYSMDTSICVHIRTDSAVAHLLAVHRTRLVPSRKGPATDSLLSSADAAFHELLYTGAFVCPPGLVPVPPFMHACTVWAPISRGVSGDPFGVCHPPVP
jgi:hypothetical protein